MTATILWSARNNKKNPARGVFCCNSMSNTTNSYSIYSLVSKFPMFVLPAPCSIMSLMYFIIFLFFRLGRRVLLNHTNVRTYIVYIGYLFCGIEFQLDILLTDIWRRRVFMQNEFLVLGSLRRSNVTVNK